MIYLFTLIIIFISLSVYWYIKFRYVFPLCERIDYLEKVYVRFEDFINSVFSVSSNLHKDEYINLLNMIFVKFNSIFNDISVYVFENSNGEWSYIGGVNNGEWGINFSKIENFLSNAGEELLFIENGDLFDGQKRKFVIMPVGRQNKKIFAIILYDSDEKDIMLHYLRFLLSFIRFAKSYYEYIENTTNENKRLKMELDGVVRELETQGSKLIKKQREAKIIYEGITSFSIGNENPLNNLLSLLYNLIKPNFVVYYSYNENNKNLVPVNSVGREINSQSYAINIDLRDSLIVKTFLNNNILYVYDESEIKDPVLKENNIKTAILLPVYNLKTKFGVLIIAMNNRKNLTNEDISFIELISKEISIIVNILDLYNRISQDAANLVNLNKIKDEFIATINHEIKTPLTTIKGFASVLMSGEVGSLNDQQISFLNMVDQATNRLINIVTNLLDISKLNSDSAMDAEESNFIDVVKNCVASMNIKAYQKEIKLSFESQISEAIVMIDKHWIAQVINNLIDNAIKYSPKKSEVNVKIYDRGSIVVFMVEDKGYGIDEEDKKYIFEKFYRAKDTMLNVNGSGLGLNIAKTIVEKHNGRIWFESQKGKGSRFYFALPKIKSDFN